MRIEPFLLIAFSEVAFGQHIVGLSLSML